MSTGYKIGLDSKSGVYYNKEITVSLGSMLCRGHARKWDIWKIGWIICKIIMEFLSWMRTFFAYQLIIKETDSKSIRRKILEED